MTFRLQRIRFELEAMRPLVFPTPASNKLRGAIGATMRERGDGSYEEFFAPVAMHGPSGLSDPPRPFVLRSGHLDGKQFAAGERFEFVVHLFAAKWLEALRGSIEGIAGIVVRASEVEEIELGLDAAPKAVSRIRVEFLTPTELKMGGRTVDRPEFGIVATRVRDRISTLRQLYGEGPLEIDFAGFGERANQVVMTECEFHRVEAQRKSGSTAQVHSLGGFVGVAVYEGELGEFVPYLTVAEWTGVGRQTSWGKGTIRVTVF